jgi:HlyD family secretion protein
MKRAAVVVLVLAVAAAAVGFAYFRAAPDRLTLAGTIEARTVQVGSLVGGRIATVQVKEGDTVAKGQTVVTFEPDLIDPQIAQQRAAVAEMRAALQRTAAGPRLEDREQLRIDYDNAEVNRKRLQGLLAAGAISRQEYDDAAAKAAKAQEAYLAAQRGGRREDVSSSAAQLGQAESHLAFLERQRRELLVSAPAAGLVQTIDLRPGDLVPADSPVATLLEPDQIWVRVYVPEPKLGLVRLGQPAALQVDAWKGRTFPGRVVEIRSQAEYTPRNVETLDQRNDLVFGVKVEIVPDPALKPGMAATVILSLRDQPGEPGKPGGPGHPGAPGAPGGRGAPGKLGAPGAPGAPDELGAPGAPAERRTAGGS